MVTGFKLEPPIPSPHHPDEVLSKNRQGMSPDWHFYCFTQAGIQIISFIAVNCSFFV
jgi:hypothetical protein